MKDANGFGWFGSPTPVPSPDQYLDVIQHGTAAERCLLAGIEDLPEDILAALTADQDLNVLKALAMNPTVPATVLDVVVREHPEMSCIAADNPNAAPYLKDTIPIRIHTELSIWRYLEDRQATESERDAVMREYRSRLDRAQSPPLGEVWRRVRPPT